MRFILALILCFLPLMPAHAQTQEARDRGIITAFLEDNLSGAGRQIIITGFAGTLSSRVTMEQLTIADDQGIWLTLNGVVLDWNRSAILSGNIEITELSAREILVARPPVAATGPDLPEPEARGFALPELPVSINIGRIAANRISIDPSVLGQPVEGTLAASMVLSGGEGQASLVLQRVGAGPQGRIALDGSYANATRQLVLNLTAAEDAGGIAATLIGLPGAPALELSVQGAGPLSNFGAQLRLATAGQPRLTGSLRLTEGEDRAQRFAVDMGGDLAPVFLPQYADFFGPEVRLVADGARDATGRLDLSRLQVTARALRLQGALVVGADGLPSRIDLTGQIADPTGAPVRLPLASEQDTLVDRADLRVQFDARQGEGWSGGLSVSGLSRPGLELDRAELTGSGRITRAAGGIGGQAIGGTLTYAAEGLAPADAALRDGLGARIGGQAVLSWSQGDGRVTVGRLTLDGADFGLAARGAVDGLAEGLRLDGTLDLRAADLARFAGLAGRPLAGAVQGRVTGQGSPLGGEFDLVARLIGSGLAVGQAELDGLLAGDAAVDLSVRRDGTGTQLRDLRITAGRGTVSASGTIASEASDLVLRADLADLSVLGPGYTGALAADMTLRGNPEAGEVTLTGQGTDLRLARPDIGRLLDGQSILDVALAWRGQRVEITRGTVTNPQAAITAQGVWDPVAGSDLTATARLADLSALRAGMAGSLDARASVTGTMAQGRITAEGTGNGLRMGQTQADRVLGGDATFRLTAVLDDGRIGIETAEITTPQVTASATGSLTDDRREVAIEARLADLALLVPEFPGPLTVEGQVTDDSRGYNLTLALRGPGQIDANVTGRLASGFDDADLIIAGTTQAALANAFLGSRSVTGGLAFDLRMAGRPSLAALSGPVRLTGGRFADPSLPFALSDLSATATLGGGAAQVQAGASLSTGGSLSATGSIGLAAPYAADLAMTLDTAVLRDPDLYRTTANGRLTVSGPLTGGASIAGRIDLGETEIRIPSSGFGGAGLVEGLEHVAESADVRATRARAGALDSGTAGGGGGGGRPFALDVTVSAPNRVFLRGRGLDAELGGQVILRGTTAAIAPQGGIALIRGRLDILGRRLDLTTASITLEGDLVPTLDVSASNVSDGVTTTVSVTGRADEPEVSFTSSPELPEEEVLARLLFGRGLESMSAFQAAQLATAVAELAGRGGEGIVSRLRRGFGLDDLDLQTSADGSTALRAGRYISENLYSDVEVNSGGQTQINLNFDVRPGLTVKGSVGTEGDAGIGIYLEKDY